MGARGFAKAVAEPVQQWAWAPQQDRIFHWFEGFQDYDNLVVRARAGTGKSTTIIEGVRRAPEEDILVCAFNKPIAEVLNEKLAGKTGAEASTLHALGYRYIRREWRGMPVTKYNARAKSLTDRVCGLDVPDGVKKLVTKLHTKVREMAPRAMASQVLDLALFFDCVPQDFGKFDLDYVVASVLRVLDVAATKEPTYDIGIDFADMINLPLIWGLTAKDFDMVVVDEAQDMTGAQLELAQVVCRGRMCVVGDDRQAIYGFRGADSNSIDRLKMQLNAGELPLNETFRCGKNIVTVCQSLVPDFVANSNNHDGVVDTMDYFDMVLTHAKAGDFILSRINAPLMSTTLRLLKQGKRARMKGRDIGGDIQDVLKKLGVGGKVPVSLPELSKRLDQWESSQVTRFASYGRLDMVDKTRDQADMLRMLLEGAESTDDLMNRIDWLFTDVAEADTILCSSVHKAKGLETDRVYVLQESFYRRGRTIEEDNCLYVARSRAKSHLTFVEGVPNL
jgi:superfamily I DNA/RNA helicase